MKCYIESLLTSLDLLVEALLVFLLAMVWAVIKVALAAIKAIVLILCHEPFSASKLICDAKETLPV